MIFLPLRPAPASYICLLFSVFRLLYPPPMPYEIFLAFRHLRSHGRRQFARVTAVIAVISIAVGVAALIIALALANGFRDEMQDKILRGTAHLTVMRSDAQPMTDYKDVANRINAISGVINASGTTYDGAVIVGPRASAYAVLRGIDGSAAQVHTEVKGSLTEGSADRLFTKTEDATEFPPVVLGAELATRAGLKVGDAAEVIAASFSAADNRRRFVRVAGIFRSGLFEYDSTWIYMPLETAAAFSNDSHAASVVSVQVKNIYEVKQVASSVRQALGSSYTTVDWQEANRPLFTALAVERRIGLVIIALIILIGALNITTTLILIVMERRREIGVLRTLGATTKSILSLFVIEGAVVGLIGAVAGLLLGAAGTYFANRYHLISLPADVYSISGVTLKIYWRDMSLAALVAFLLSVIATIYPARAAARIRPAEILKD